MGDYSKAVFRRGELPEIAVIRAGAHFIERAERTLQYFDDVEELRGTWMPYCYGKVNKREVLIVFNVYGAATMLEIIRLLEDGGVKYIGFIGSAFSKKDPVGQQLLIKTIFDQAGIALLDGVKRIERQERLVEMQREIFVKENVPYSEVNLVSVPAVMHGIDSVNEFIARDEVDALEMELSTFFHFTQQSGIDTFAFVYVSDNPTNPVLQTDRQQIRNDAMKLSSKLLRELIDTLE